jgi:hypothetical protein
MFLTTVIKTQFRFFEVTGVFVLLCSAGYQSAAAQTLPLAALPTAEFKPLSDTALVDRAARLAQALEKLERRISQMKDADGWRAFFACDQLRTFLADIQHVSPKQVAAVLPQYYQNHPQCEWNETRDVRTRIVSLIAAMETNRFDDFEGEYYRRIEKLRTLTDEHSTKADSATAIEIARTLHWLRRAGQGKPCIEQVRQSWAMPNFIADIGIETLAPKELDDLVVDRSPVVDNILGTAIRGQANTEGRVSMRLVPSEKSGIFELELRGKTHADSVGVNGPATLQMSSNSTFVAVTRVRMTPDGLVYDPPQAKANLQSQTNNLEVAAGPLPGLGTMRKRFVERIAWKRAEEMKPQADAIAARRSETRYEQSMAEYVSQSLEKTNQPFREKFRGPLLRMGAIYESIGFSTTTEAVQARMLFADGMELGADTEPPEFKRSHSLSLRIHESLLRNAGHMLLRGATVADRTLAKFMKGAYGEIPREAREFRLGSHLERWSITLADEHPLLLDFAPEVSTIGLRVQQVTIGEAKIPQDLLVVAKYRIEGTPQGPCLRRLGKVQVVSKERAPTKEQSEAVAFLERKASGFFISEIWFDGLVPPAGGPFDKYAQLSFKELIVSDGWLALGYDQMQTSGDRTASSSAKARAVR